MNTDLLGVTSRVEVPFVIVNIGGYAFGVFDKSVQPIIDQSGFTRRYVASYPNYIDRLSVTKVNGSVNTYNLSLNYAIQAGDDPNKIDKILSLAANSRQIIFSYGDYSAPQYAYKDEAALITNVTSTVNVQTSVITYNITAVGGAVQLNAGTQNYSRRKAKPSDVIKELLRQESSGLQSVFPGMRDYNLVLSKGLIASDDAEVAIEAQSNISTLDYLKYLVTCMSSTSDISNSITDRHMYMISIEDDFKGIFGGAYFRIIKVAKSSAEVASLDAFEIDIGYPTSNIVTNFSINSNEAYTILYDFAGKVQQSTISYRINDEGDFDYDYSPSLARDKRLYITTEAEKNWWNRVTQYPITATLTIRGLLKPAMLMSYVKLNVYFYGQKHISSGLYIITQQVDEVGLSGFFTTLSLTRIGGDTV